VLNTAGRLVGLIPKRFVVEILKRKSFYDRESTDRTNYMDPSQAANIIEDPYSGGEYQQVPLINSKSQELDKSNAHEFELDYDEKNGFPATPRDKVLPWTCFFTDILSTETDAERVILDVIEENFEEWIDLRPYMIESPLFVSQNDKLQKVLDQFRLNHCRHLLVVDPSNGNLSGVVTRKDLFAYCSL